MANADGDRQLRTGPKSSTEMPATYDRRSPAPVSQKNAGNATGVSIDRGDIDAWSFRHGLMLTARMLSVADSRRAVVGKRC